MFSSLSNRRRGNCDGGGFSIGCTTKDESRAFRHRLSGGVSFAHEVIHRAAHCDVGVDGLANSAVRTDEINEVATGNLSGEVETAEGRTNRDRLTKPVVESVKVNLCLGGLHRARSHQRQRGRALAEHLHGRAWIDDVGGGIGFGHEVEPLATGINDGGGDLGNRVEDFDLVVRGDTVIGGQASGVIAEHVLDRRELANRDRGIGRKARRERVCDGDGRGSRTHLGRRVPAHATATGMVVLGWCPRELIQTTFSDPLESSTEGTPLTVEAPIAQQSRHKSADTPSTSPNGNPMRAAPLQYWIELLPLWHRETDLL
ncbi:MAG: hypothetical protein EOP83_14400 [Verrucomicrobiaceae bacterium]|nr:MAG: hypothetical protein EOP83_14400 [Verrucomicrobiaceae bacterium]